VTLVKNMGKELPQIVKTIHQKANKITVLKERYLCKL